MTVQRDARTPTQAQSLLGAALLYHDKLSSQSQVGAALGADVAPVIRGRIKLNATRTQQSVIPNLSRGGDSRIAGQGARNGTSYSRAHTHRLSMAMAMGQQ